MTDGEISSYMKKVSGFMVGSFILWIIIVCYQLIAGIFTMFWGYGIGTLLLMVYNLIGCIRYAKQISVIRNCSTKDEAAWVVRYFENSIPICWVFLFVNLIFGGVLGFAGNLYDLILAYRVKKKKDELLGQTFYGNYREEP
ncbi:MAG: hypothetical protein K5879_06885 [Lachnospiraceae bacterium]|nr:hypothetical protein [Lachnospiraceae bacterium]